MRWWMGVAEGFHARRAVLAVDEAALPRLSVTWVDPSSPEDGVRALGPAAADAADPRQPVGRTFYISEAQCKTLADALRAEGVFGRERLPGHARLGRAKHVLDVSFGVEGKRFETSADPAEPWMQHVAAAIEDLARGSRWQLFHDRAKVGTQRAFWEAEHAWWDQPHTALERALREKEGVLACLESSDPSQRAEPLQELARLYDVTGVPAAADFPRLLALLAAERTAGDRASLVTSLALRAARGTAQDGGIAPELSAELQSALVVALGPAAESELERVLEAGGASGAVDAAHATEPVVRRAAARILAKRSDDAAHAELLRMIDDSDAGVEVEAIDALGAARVESARNEIFVRARLGAGTVRAAALRAVGRLGGDGAREALMLGLAEKDEAIQQAAVSGLAELRDPQSASLLVSIFARGAGTPLFEPARKGLFDLGQDAVPELLRLTASSAPATCREAALVLAREDVPRAAPVLMRILTDDPSDSAVAAELAVLTCVDERGQSDPASAWWSWWDLVVHDDSLAWLLGAAEGEGLSAPPAAAFAGKGTRAAADFLVDLLGVPKAHLQERARRELSRLLGRELQDPPAKPAALAAWRADLRAEVERVFGESSG